MRLLVTRPEPDAERTAEELRARGHVVLLAPLLAIEGIADTALGDGPWDAVLMTSANAARALAAHPQHADMAGVPAFVVGQHTAEVARAFGFSHIESADGDVPDLATLVATRLPQQSRLLYLAGEERSGDLAGIVGAAGFIVDTIVIYRSVAATHFPEPIRDAFTQGLIEGVLHFSKRSAAAFAAAAEQTGLSLKLLNCIHFCLSSQVAEALSEAPAGQVRVAIKPDEISLFKLIGDV